MAYLKAHYKEIFLKKMLSMTINSESKMKEYIYEAKSNGINILRPDINLSSYEFTIDNNNLRYPLSAIKNLGSQAVNTILEQRKINKYKDIYDFINRCYSKSVNSKTLESLILAGCFTSFGYNKQTLIKNLDVLVNYGDIVKEIDESLVEKPELTIYPEYEKPELMNQELEMFGLYISNHPITEYKLKNKNCISLIDLSKHFDKVIETIVIVDKIKEINTKKNEKMMFITGSDELTTIDFVIFPKVYQKIDSIEKNMIIHVTGKVEKRFDQLQVVVDEIFTYE